MATRNLSLGKKLSMGGGHLRVIHHRPLELIADDFGSVTLGWVDVGVFYARFIGMLSIELSQQHNQRLQAAIDRRESLSYFADARALGSYDLAARTAFFRMLMANRSRFKKVLLLTWPAGISPSVQGYVTAIGEPVQIVADERDFEKRLLETAPLARGKIDPNGWLLPPADTRPTR